MTFTKKYYPELVDSFNDASIGSWFIDLMSAVGDDLSYHTDRMYQETNLDSASLRSSVLNAARLNGVKIPGPKCSMCEVEISVVIPISTDNSTPDWKYAPLLKRGSTVGNTQYEFELSEDVDFASQFNSDGVSNRKFIPMRNGNNFIHHYKVTKTVLVYGGNTRIYKKVLGESEVVPFMEIILPEQNICNVESIIFKETASLNNNPQMFEFFIDEDGIESAELLEDTEKILSVLYTDYLATEEEREIILNKEKIISNSKISNQINNDIEIKEIFLERNKKKITNENSKNTNDLLIMGKEKWYTKLFNFIKKIFDK